MSRLTLVTAALALSTAGCKLTDLPSNLPDSGIVCAIDDAGTDAGTGSVTGAHAFTVHSAYEVLQQLDDRATLSVQLYDEPRTCDSIRWRDADGGAPANDAGAWRYGTLTARVYSRHGGAVEPGTFPIGFSADSGYAALDLFRLTFDAGVDGGLALETLAFKSAASGTVTLSSVEACNVAGSFSAQLRETDGGTTAIGGAFSAAYCPTR